jgi:predicted proteasome-type protease
MGAPLHLDSQQAVIELMQRAIESDRGLQLNTRSPKEARDLRDRLYKARRAVARENRKVYPKDHPQHNKSLFESLIFTIEGSILRLVKGDAILVEVKEL